MSRIPGTLQSRRRPRQGTPEAGRSRARSIAPVLVLGTCMIAVLYGNISYYSESLHSSANPARGDSPGLERHQQSTPSLESKQRPAEGIPPGHDRDEVAPVGAGADGAADRPPPQASLADEEQLPRPPAATAEEGGEKGGDAAAATAATVLVERDGEGGVQELNRWDDDREGNGDADGAGAVQSLTVGGADVEPEPAVATSDVGEEDGGEGGGEDSGGGGGGGEDSGSATVKDEEEAAALLSLMNEEGVVASASSGSRGGDQEGGEEKEGAEEQEGGGGGGGGEGEQERGGGGEQDGGGEEEQQGEGGREGEQGGGEGGEQGGGQVGGQGGGGGEQGGGGGDQEGGGGDQEGGREQEGEEGENDGSGIGEGQVEGGEEEQGSGDHAGSGYGNLLQQTDERPPLPPQAAGLDASEEVAEGEGAGDSDDNRIPDHGDHVIEDKTEEGVRREGAGETTGGGQEKSGQGGAPEGEGGNPAASFNDSSRGVSASRSSSDSTSKTPSGVARVETNSGSGGEEGGEGGREPGDASGGSSTVDSGRDRDTGVGAGSAEAPASHSSGGAATSGGIEEGTEKAGPQLQEERLTSAGGAPEALPPNGDGEGDIGEIPDAVPLSAGVNGGTSAGEQAEELVELVEVTEVGRDSGEAGGGPDGAHDGGQPETKEGDVVTKDEGDGGDGNRVNRDENGDENGDDGNPDGGGEAVVAGAAKNGAVEGTMECASTRLGAGVDNIVNIATWKDVPGDAMYRNPLAEENSGRYVTLQKDLGGFNNIRLSLECGVAFAAATGRTFVIPPPFTIWNMNDKKKRKEVDIRELFSFDKLRDSGRVRVITTQEFLETEASPGNLGVRPWTDVMNLDVKAVTTYMEAVAEQYEGGLPEMKVERSALVMPRRKGDRVELENEEYAFAKEWLYNRELLEYTPGQGWAEAKVIHWRAKEARLLAPFYAFVLHADEVSERYHKRILRDLLHYPEEVYCKASQIISLLRQEDPSGDFSTFHVRRNDFLGMYKMVNIPLGQIIANSLDHLEKNEVVYVATDEKDLSVFDPFKEHIQVKFLKDYYERAGVSELNPNLIGMLDQIIASHGRTFTGCWLSTFTAYILRLRGHLQKPRTSNWTYYNARKTYHHEYHLPENPLWMTEWPFGWEDLDKSGVPDAMAP